MPLSPAELTALRDLERGLVGSGPATRGGGIHGRYWLWWWYAGAAGLVIVGLVQANTAAMVLAGTWVLAASAARWMARHLVLVYTPPR